MVRTLEIQKQILYVTGLPRSGSTLLCQLLGLHPDIYSTGHSSPLAPLLENIRHSLSDNQFLLAQLDVDFDLAYRRLVNAYRGLITGWFAETELPCVVDKNRGWLAMVETVKLLDPNFRMIVCVRDPLAVFGSVEAQHQKTLLLDFPDHIAANSAYDRADSLFANAGVIGAPMRMLEHLQDIGDRTLADRIFYVRFEDLVRAPRETMRAIYSWSGLRDAPFDPERLPVKPHESDSYYRFKYRHATHGQLSQPEPHPVSARIAQEIVKKYGWFYHHFYPELDVAIQV